MTVEAQIINDAGVVLGAVGVFTGLAKTQWWPKFVGFVKKDGVTIVQGVENVAEAFVDTPAVKLQLDHAQNEYNSLLAKFKESELAKVTATVLNAFSETLDQLTSTQKEAIVLQISTMLPKEWNITKPEIEVALDTIQKSSDSVAEVPYIKTANQFKQDVQESQTVSA